MDLDQIWKSAMGELEVELGKQQFNLYFKNSELVSLENGVAKIGFLNKGVALQTNQRYYALIQNTLQKISGISPLSLVFDITDKPLKVGLPDGVLAEVGPLFETPKEDKEAIQEAIQRAHLRRDFTLEEFCVSTSNQLAFAAAQAVTQKPGQNYNPFFIWGSVGIGKTHLMQAIGHEILRKNPRARVIYAPGEQFTNEIVQGIRTKNTSEVKDKYRNADALLIDDVQFIAGKDTVQEEFFHTFNALQQKGAQVVLTSDTKPGDIKYLEDRLRSRFEGGMVADISEPDHELKTAICILKAKKRGIELSTNAGSLIASNVDNIRSLEGTVISVIQYAAISKSEITEELIHLALKLPANKDTIIGGKKRLDSKLILDAVLNFYNLPLKMIRGEKRDKPIVVPRQILMYLLKNSTGMTYEEIAAFLERKDHTTVIHGVKKITSLMETDDRIKNEITQLQNTLGV